MLSKTVIHIDHLTPGNVFMRTAARLHPGNVFLLEQVQKSMESGPVVFNRVTEIRADRVTREDNQVRLIVQDDVLV